MSSAAIFDWRFNLRVNTQSFNDTDNGAYKNILGCALGKPATGMQMLTILACAHAFWLGLGIWSTFLNVYCNYHLGKILVLVNLHLYGLI